jgi:hypothetical protein
MSDKLIVLLDDPEIRETIVALNYSYPGGLHGLAATSGHSLLADNVVSSVAAAMESEAAEVARQLRQLLPDLLDALAPDGRLIPATELTTLLRVDIALDENEAGAFGG